MTYFKTKDKVTSGQRLLSYRAFLGIKKPLSISSLALKLINICQTLDKIKKVQFCLAKKNMVLLKLKIKITISRFMLNGICKENKPI